MHISDVRWSDLLEDMIGFGARSLHSMRDIIVRPRDYFVAAQSADWSGYTPSFRIYIALFAVSSYLRFLYLGDSGMMTEVYTDVFAEALPELAKAAPELTDADPRRMADTTLSGLFTWVAPLQFAIYSLFGLAWGAYGEKLPAPVRVRYLYALMIPATLFMLAVTPLMILAPMSLAPAISVGSIVLTGLVVGLVAYRGAYPLTLPAAERAVRAGTLGLLLMLVMTVATTVALVIGMSAAVGEALHLAGS